MNDLQIALIAFGGVLVGAVWGYNLWQEKKHRQRAEAVLPVKDAAATDVLMAGRESLPDDAPRSEPGFHDSGAGEEQKEPRFEGPQQESQAAGLAAFVASAATPAEKRIVPVPAEWSDGLADCLLRIEFADPVSVAVVWAEHSEWTQRIDKPMQWIGFDGQALRWRTLRPQDAFSTTQIAAALQLANRKGAVNEKTLANFVSGVHQLAQHFSGLVELPDQPAVIDRAQALDGFCAGVDLQLDLFVIPRQGSLNNMVGAKLKPEIEKAGLRLEGERYVAVDAAEAEVFAMVCQAAVAFAPEQLDSARLTALSFSLDVPRVANGAAGFDRMVACARRCADVLGGQLVDAHKKPLTENTVTAIRNRIEDLQGQMKLRDIPAGGVRALRLFA